MNDPKLDILEYATQNCVYYKNYSNKRWEDLPYINKSIVNKNKNDFIYISPKNMNLVKTSTSGTSGEVLDIYWSKSEYINSLMTLWKQRFMYHIYPADKFCTAHSFFDNDFVGYNSLIQINKQRNCLSFNKIFLDDEHLKFYCEQIAQFKPKWLFLQPSIALRLAQYYKNNKIDPPNSIEFIESSGEILTNNIREQLHEIFNDAQIANNYGAQEFNCIAYECKCGKLHVNSDNVHIDVGENNQFYITNLLNYTMPLIRYSLGDMVEDIQSSENCNCGNSFPILHLKKGRETDTIKLNGITYDCSLFFYIIDKLNALYNNIFLQFYVEQIKDKLNIYLLTKDSDFKITKDTLKNDINVILSLMGIFNNNINIILNNKLPLTNAGKLNYFKIIN